jgi:hypothetical protein
VEHAHICPATELALRAHEILTFDRQWRSVDPRVRLLAD